MDAFQAFVAVLPLILRISVLPQLTTATNFSLKLIHRDSIESPLYPGNLSFHERLQRNLEISESRVTYLMSTRKHKQALHPDMMHPYVVHYPYLYLVQIGIGTPNKDFWLGLDTGSDFGWTQCQPCKTCFYQRYPIYDPRNSSSYKKVPCDSPVCNLFKCINGECLYDLEYMDNSSTKGVASWETFNVMSPHEPVTRLVGALFGCSYENHGFPESTYGGISGMLGLSKGPKSIIIQLGSFIKRRFSYCFTDPLPSGKYPLSYLKFGTDMGYRGGAVQTTPFLNHSSYRYYLNLLDISVDNKRLNYPPHTFDIKPNGDGGCFIDSGTFLTYIHRDAYWNLHHEFVSYFDRFGLQRTDCPFIVKLCYEAGFKSFPSMTYHFQGANLTITPEHLFIKYPDKKYFLLVIAPDNATTVLGQWQQRNTRFVYDLNINSLSFAPENCAEDKG